MLTLRVSRKYLRRRSGFALAVLLLAAIAAFWITIAGHRGVEQHSKNISAIDEAFVSLAELSLAFERIQSSPASQKAIVERSRIRLSARTAVTALTAIKAAQTGALLSARAQTILTQRSLNPLTEFEDILFLTKTLTDPENQRSASETSKSAALASKLSRRLLPVLMQVKKAEDKAAQLASSRQVFYSILAILTGVYGVLAAAKYVYLPMERFIIKAQSKIEESRRRAEAASEAKSVFLATMSHEIRTPLNGILGLSELLMDTELDDQQRQMIRTMTASGNSLLRIINDVLDLSKAEAGELKLEAEVFDAHSLCQEAIDLFSPQARSKNISLGLAAGPGKGRWRVSGYSTAVRQIVVNLISNAVKFTERGSIVIGLTEGAAQTTGMRTLRIAVRDTGIGIPQEARERIFEQFTQADTSRTARVGGTGLGLAIARKLTEAINGRIYLESKTGSGSEFILEFPVENAPAADEELDSAQMPSITFSKKVLVAEDNRVNQIVVVKLLEGMGCSTKVAANGAEAVELEESWSPDLVLMDVRMPEMDGLDATRAIRKKELEDSLPAVPIIGLSANAMREDHDAGISAGMCDYLSKPINKAKLANALARLWPNEHYKPKEATVRCA
ncbi:ATP-binding protein [Leisingera daeponensis]|uniref:ATP-binding protein n=1 Tax=Leisingera daeponensis TaxID=405746 RepID=UPI001C95E12F|nr:ATP-binding protein [Leisingera daeponensis]MBY6059112.1 response regulator [Leisingera daeponensis]